VIYCRADGKFAMSGNSGPFDFVDARRRFCNFGRVAISGVVPPNAEKETHGTV
jgi:hypothetical protein